MSPARTTASDSLNEIATVRIELRDTDPVTWRQVEVPTSVTLRVLHDIVQAVMATRHLRIRAHGATGRVAEAASY